MVVAATGFDLCVLGDIAFSIDGKPLTLGDTVTYRGMMFTGVPNLVWVFGYFRASWTLRADMVARIHLPDAQAHEGQGRRIGDAAAPPRRCRHAAAVSWIDPEDFNPSYIQRSIHLLPKRGPKRDWQHTQDYWREKDEFPADQP